MDILDAIVLSSKRKASLLHRAPFGISAKLKHFLAVEEVDIDNVKMYHLQIFHISYPEKKGGLLGTPKMGEVYLDKIMTYERLQAFMEKHDYTDLSQGWQPVEER